MNEVEQITQARIRRAQETLVAIDRFLRERTADSAAAMHELHASHLRESGDQEGAAHADERALHAKKAWAQSGQRPPATRPGG